MAPVAPLNSDSERRKAVLEKAWLLGDDLIESARPGQEKELYQLLYGDFDNPLAYRDDQDIEHPHVHLLRVIGESQWFPFTCERIFNIKILPIQHIILEQLWEHQFPMLIGSRGMGKSFLLALYTMLRALIHQGTKVVIVGSAFRQAKVVFEYVEQIWANAPVLQDLCGAGKGRNNRKQGPRRDIDRCECIIGESIIIALPLGDGKKIRGQRANIIVADEFASINPEIYETVIKGFGAVSQDPVGNVQEEARLKLMRKMDLWTQEMDAQKTRKFGNQSILSGTASYSFNWFARYWNRYKAIIESKGDRGRLAELSEDGSVDPTLDPRDYAVIRVPSTIIPDGFMDEKTIASSRAMSNSSIHLMEYGACFVGDSDGFYRMSLIQSCVAGGPGSEVGIHFTAQLKGDKRVKHILGVDPAAQSDNFAITVVAVYPNHRRVVYCWTTRKKEYLKRKKVRATSEKTFYAFAARKIREIMKAFPTERIVMDAQGGGDPGVMEALQDTDKLLPGEEPIYEVIDPDPKKRKDSDAREGLHIVELVQFADARWVCEANHGMKKDLEDKHLLFPHLDAPLLGLAVEQAKKDGQLFDTLDDCAVEIEDLKHELTTIVHSQTDAGRERWDTPKVKGEQHGSGRLRKDRYSALLMANMAARQMQRDPGPLEVVAVGGWAHEVAVKGQSDDGPLYKLGGKWRHGGLGDFGVAIPRQAGPAV